MTEYLHKSMTFEVKADGSLGRFSGIASTYGNVDQAGDVMVRGCFARSIAAKGNHYPLLWQHSTDEVIGSFDVTSTEEALAIEGKFNMDVQRGREGYALLKAGDICGLSIGFVIKDCDWDADGVRLIKEAELWEVSLVSFPCNLEATAEAKKMDLSKKMTAYSDMDEEQQSALKQLIKDVLKAIEDEDEPDEGPKQDPAEEDGPAGEPEDESENKSEGNGPEDEEESKAIRDIIAELKSIKKKVIA